MESSYAKDPLTDLPSRAALTRFLHAATGSDSRGLQVFSVQLSRFGNVNSSIGSELADKVICLIAKRLRKVFQDALFIARTHGDHFSLVFDANTSTQTIVNKLHDFTQRPFAIRGEVIVLSVKIGVAILGEHALNDPNTLLHASEVALSECKREGLKFSAFTQDMFDSAKKLHTLENDLRLSIANNYNALHKALHENEFELYYQPIVNCKTNNIEAFEALIRWNHSQKGLIPPFIFISVAEQIQIMDVLGAWILKRAMLDAASWPLNRANQRIGVSINLSPTQFKEEKILMNAIEEAFILSAMDPNLVKLEITESTSFGKNMVNVISQIRDLGCKIALDDFGTGYSSLTQLNQLPLDYLKLDRSFIKDLDIDDEAKRLLCMRMSQAVMTLVDTFKLIPIVEGVETKEQLKVVEGMGAQLIQGYLYSKPMRASEVHAFIQNFNAN